MDTENIMFIIPPLLRSSSISYTPVSQEKPFMPVSNRDPRVQSGWKMTPTIPPARMPRVIPGIAGIFMATATITTTGGSRSRGLIWNIS